MHYAPLIVERSQCFCCMTTFHFQWNLPLTLPSPRDGANKAGATRGERMKGEGTCAYYATLGSMQLKTTNGHEFLRLKTPLVNSRVTPLSMTAHAGDSGLSRACLYWCLFESIRG